MTPGTEVVWVVRQTGHGVRSWRYDSSKVHRVGADGVHTRCGVVVRRGSRTATVQPNDPRCRRCA